MITELYLGPPGTGKTTRLISITEDALKAGVSPGAIGYISFTKAAITEALGRLKLTTKSLDYFRTIHAICFKEKNFTTSMVMGKEHYQDLSERLGIELTGRQKEGMIFEELPDGDKALAIIDLARLRMEPLKQVWERLDSELGLDWQLVHLIDRALKKYKDTHFLVDYTDMLEKYLQDGPVPELELLIVDEAQDLSRLQWLVLKKLSSNCKRLILAGDDDQAIYHWAGVDVNDLLEYSRNADKVEVLSQSYRLPVSVHSLAMSLSGRISKRIPKTFLPRKEEGSVERVTHLDESHLATGKWLVLVRNRYLAGPVVDLCLRSGYLYSFQNDSPSAWSSVRAAWTWESLRKGRKENTENVKAVIKLMSVKYDKVSMSLFLGRKEDIGMEELRACGIKEDKPWFEVLDKINSEESEFIRAALRNKEKLREPPRIRIDTIHGSKGMEEDNVLLFTDQSYRTWRGMNTNQDDETRVFYVGVTRAKQRLVILEPQTQYFFDL